MTDPRASFLKYFLHELDCLNDDGVAFAKAFPSVAAALDFGAQGTSDPHVERLIEAFAFIAARIQRNIDQQLPKIAAALMETIYPHLVAPVPSLSLVEFSVDPARARAAEGFRLPRGTEVFTETEDGAACRFRTAWEVELWPLEAAGADQPDPVLFPFMTTGNQSINLLRLRLQSIDGWRIGDILPEKLRFAIVAPMVPASLLYEAIVGSEMEIWVVDPAGTDGSTPAAFDEEIVDCAAIRLPPKSVTAVGFDPDESLLPHPANAHISHRLLQEYFVFPQKFLFFDLSGLEMARGLANSAWLDVIIRLRNQMPIPAGAEKGAFRLGVVPIVNLFSQLSEPIRIDHTRSEYLVYPDLQLERSTEIYSINKVTLTSAENRDSAKVYPYYSFHHNNETAKQNIFWASRRDPTGRADIAGSDVYISFHDRSFDPGVPPSQVAYAHTLCTNRGLAEQVPRGASFWLDVDAPVSSVVNIQRPTAQIMPPETGENLWRLISHLSVNQLSFVNSEDGLRAFKEELSLYSAGGTSWARQQINGISGLSSQRVVRHVGIDAWRGYCRGLELSLVLDGDNFIGGTPFLFGSVLSRFFGFYAGASSFIELVMWSKQREEEKIRWDPRSGEQIVA